MSDDSSSAPAGWYPDPADDARLRRWDGSRWTQDVILAPEESPVAFVPSAPTPPPTAPQYAPPQPAPPQYAPPQPAPPQPAAPQFAEPHRSQPQAPSVPPPPAAQPTVPVAQPSTPPAPPKPESAPSEPKSGPVDLPEWATLPGLTLPPDLSMIPGMATDSVLAAPTFVEPAPVFASQPRILPPPDWSRTQTPEPSASARPAETRADAPPQPPTRDDTPPTAPNFPPPPLPRRGPAPAEHYAPPPGGAQYDAPPPPGASPAPGASIALPASSLVAPRMPSAAWAAGPVIDRNAAAPLDFSELPRTSAGDELAPSGSLLTPWVWLIAVLPLLQFVIIYLVFVQLAVAFSPGVQWGILAAPAAFSLLLASVDRRALIALGVDRVPSPLLALVAPVYLLVRSFDVGRASIGALVAWILLQAGAVAGVVYLMPHVLSQAIAAS